MRRQCIRSVSAPLTSLLHAVKAHEPAAQRTNRPLVNWRLARPVADLKYGVGVSEEAPTASAADHSPTAHTLCFNPGPFQADLSFMVYRPATREAEFSRCGGSD